MVYKPVLHEGAGILRQPIGGIFRLDAANPDGMRAIARCGSDGNLALCYGNLLKINNSVAGLCHAFAVHG